MKLPGYPQKGKAVEDTVRGLIDYARATTVTGFVGGRVVQNANGTTLVAGKQKPTRPGGGTPGPFWPTLGIGGTAETPTYYVTVTRGVIIDRDTTDADAVVYFEPVVLTTGEPTEFAITDTQSVYVHFETDDTGAITGTPEIIVADSDQESIHYAPPAGSATAGTDGDYYYKLATFAVGPPAELTMFGAGDNVCHYRELPLFLKAGGTADVFKEFNASEGKYKTRGLIAGVGITVTENSDSIEIKRDGDGWWGAMTFTYTPAMGSSQYLTMTFEAGVLTAIYSSWTSGYITGTEGTPGTANYTAQDTDT